MIGCVCMALTGCDTRQQESKTAASAPAAAKNENFIIDQKSPDLAVKTWWRWKDRFDKWEVAECNRSIRDDINDRLVDALPKIAAGEVLEFHHSERSPCREAKVEREIQEVKTESETRAVVYATIRDVMPVPEGQKLNEYDIQFRKDGFRFKYVVEKHEVGWKIASVYRYDDFNKQLGRSEWTKVYNRPDPTRYTGSMGSP